MPDETRQNAHSVALELKIRHRIPLGVFAALLAAAVAAILLTRQTGGLPDLLLAALAIGAIVSALLAIIGRLPSGFELAGFQLNFPEDTLSDLIGTIRGLQAVDEYTKDSIIGIVRKAAGPDVFRGAISRLDEVSSEESETVGSPAEQSLGIEQTPNDAISATLATLATAAPTADYEVPNSGKGKKPKADYFFRYSSGQEETLGVITQIERYWNPTTLDLLNRKLLRSLQKSTPVDRVIVVVPDRGREVVERALRSFPSSEVRVVAESEFQNRTMLTKQLRTWLNSDAPQ